MSGDVSLAADPSFPGPQGYSDRKAVLVIRQSLDDDAVEAVVGEPGTGMIHLAHTPRGSRVRGSSGDHRRDEIATEEGAT
jgi:hypothetical protein